VDKPVKHVEDLFRTIITTAGVMLPLLWGLTQRQLSPSAMATIRWASIFFMIAIVGSLIGCQFIVTHLENDVADISKRKSVAFSFLTAWISFLIGSFMVIVAIFQFG
jgi:hypothetical protein